MNRSYSRRSWLISTGSIASITLYPGLLCAAPANKAIIEQTFPGRDIQPGRVTIELPALAENGNSVRIKVNVDSPMTDADHVTFIQLFGPENPLPDIARFEFNPASGLAEVETRIRVSAEQDIIAIAGMNDGSLWSASAHIVVTVAACLDALY